ncbi:MAG: carboxypeptidase-like regulatory domain-containing protein [Acidobacteriota bacterium]
MRKLVVLILLAVLCQTGVAALAQTQFGTISGQVEDPSGAVVADAAVNLMNIADGLTQKSASNDSGVYVLSNVPIGEYEITIEATGFQKYIHNFKMTVAERLVIDAQLEIGSIDEVVYVEANAASLNTVTGDLSTTLDNQDIQLMPLLDRNPYKLISLVPAAADTGSSAGDTGGIGITVAGTRNQAINFMLDGGENNETFTTVVAQSVPQDAIAEFRLLTNSMTSEFGRNPVVAKDVNDFHGSLYEFYRGSGLSAWNYDDKAREAAKSRFVRNQFGASLGGPVIKDKSFFFGSFEGIIVRSSTSKRFYVPTQEFISAASPDAQDFIQGFGGVPSGDTGDVLTARQIIETIDLLGPPVYELRPLIDYNTGELIDPDTPLFSNVTMKDPREAGGGDSQDTYLFTGRFDHSFSQDTRFFARVAYQQSTYPLGTISISPFTAFNSGRKQRYQNYAFSLTHNLNPSMFNESRVVFNRIHENQPLGEAPMNSPCWDYYWDTPESPIVLPGYLPEKAIILFYRCRES